jgi:hypothetical protein
VTPEVQKWPATTEVLDSLVQLAQEVSNERLGRAIDVRCVEGRYASIDKRLKVFNRCLSSRTVSTPVPSVATCG